MQKIKIDAQTRNSMSAMQRGVKKGILGLAQFVVIVTSHAFSSFFAASGYPTIPLLSTPSIKYLCRKT
jgi:hypothetical protein